jgi:hypothetical protein
MACGLLEASCIPPHGNCGVDRETVQTFRYQRGQNAQRSRARDIALYHDALYHDALYHDALYHDALYHDALYHDASTAPFDGRLLFDRRL